MLAKAGDRSRTDDIQLGKLTDDAENQHEQGKNSDDGHDVSNSDSAVGSDPGLARLNAVWPTLAPDVRARILDQIGGAE